MNTKSYDTTKIYHLRYYVESIPEAANKGSSCEGPRAHTHVVLQGVLLRQGFRSVQKREIVRALNVLEKPFVNDLHGLGRIGPVQRLHLQKKNITIGQGYHE